MSIAEPIAASASRSTGSVIPAIGLCGATAGLDAVVARRMLGLALPNAGSAALWQVGETTLACCPSQNVPIVTDDPRPVVLHRSASGEIHTDCGELDGRVSSVRWDAACDTLTLTVDAFGAEPLYYMIADGAIVFASEIKMFLMLPGFEAAPDIDVLREYLAFSFVPAERMPLRGVRRVMPGTRLEWCRGRVRIERTFRLSEPIDGDFSGESSVVRTCREVCRRAVHDRINGASQVAVYLSGGLDSSLVAVLLKETGVDLHAFTLDFGRDSVEKAEAKRVAQHLGIPLTLVKAGVRRVRERFNDLIWALDLPYGDTVTGPQLLLGEAAQRAGFRTVFNGEGGDQFFGGWTNKPLLAARMHDPLASIPEVYMKSYHRFHGRESELLTESFRSALNGGAGPGERIAAVLADGGADSFLGRVRLIDIHLKGSMNILPRAGRIGKMCGLRVEMPLFDPDVAIFAFSLPGRLKLNGACEKYMLKKMVERDLPDEIVWRPKSGMCVPMTRWMAWSMRPLIRDLLGSRPLRARDYFNLDYVKRLRRGEDDPAEVRKRRTGEKLWCLAALEGWLRMYIDGNGVAVK